MPSPDTWLVLTVHVPPEDPLRELAAEGLLAIGGRSVLEQGDALVTYLPGQADPERQASQARESLGDWLGGECPPVAWRIEPNADWEHEWRRGLKPRKVSDRIVVKPSWTHWAPGTGEVVIDIDPQMAFGTGEHATTRGCLRLLDESVTEGARVLDVGSGSGVLSIAAALLGAREVVAIEVDPDANLNARENIARNGVADRVRLIEAMADPSLLSEAGYFDVILANILSSVIQPLLPSLAEALRPEGRLIVAGILGSEAGDFTRAARGVGLAVVQEIEDEEWWSAALARS